MYLVYVFQKIFLENGPLFKSKMLNAKKVEMIMIINEWDYEIFLPLSFIYGLFQGHYHSL